MVNALLISMPGFMSMCYLGVVVSLILFSLFIKPGVDASKFVFLTNVLGIYSSLTFMMVTEQLVLNFYSQASGGSLQAAEKTFQMAVGIISAVLIGS